MDSDMGPESGHDYRGVLSKFFGWYEIEVGKGSSGVYIQSAVEVLRRELLVVRRGKEAFDLDGVLMLAPLVLALVFAIRRIVFVFSARLDIVEMVKRAR
eukprot:1382006-Amorphochlora_amoeboformis.AAC.1